MPAKEFVDLPEVRDEEDKRRVHRTAGLYFLNRSLTAHGDLACMFLAEVSLVQNPRLWRVASDAECRALGAAWCVDCCSSE